MDGSFTFADAKLDWFLVQLKPNGLKLAERNLKRQKFQTFCPLADVTRRRNGKFVTSAQPLFPGYIFVATDRTAGQWRPLNSTAGVSRIVGFNGSPAVVPQDIVFGLQVRCDPMGKLMPPAEFQMGDEVRLITGPFANFIGEVEKVDPDRRVWLLIDLMNAKRRVSAHADGLQYLS